MCRSIVYEGSGCILKTYDGGQRWEEIAIHDFIDFDNLKFVNNSTGHFINRNNLYVTTDTLNTWINITPADYSVRFSSSYNENTIFAVGSDSLRPIRGNFLSSIDGGLTWDKVTIGSGWLDQVNFTSAQVGYLLSKTAYWAGTSLWKTIDGGETWNRKIFSYPFSDVWFIDNNRGFAAGGWAAGDCRHSTCLYLGEVYLTDDGGKTWTLKLETEYVKKFFFLDDEIGYMLSWKLTSGNMVVSTISKTINSGENWFKIYMNDRDSSGYGFEGHDFTFIDEHTSYAVGKYWSDNWDTSGAAILCIRDGGTRYNLAWKDNERWNRLNSVYSSDTTIWAVGESGMLIKYTDQDAWQIQSQITDLPLSKVFFSDADHGWITGGYLNDHEIQSILLKTNDGGQTWDEIRNVDYLVYDMFFTDSLHGWALGSDTSGGGVILETYDGGNNWIPQIEDLDRLTALHFKNGVGWVVGNNGLVLRTASWTSWIDKSKGKRLPAKFSLSHNYPNPFNAKTVINYKLKLKSHVNLSIYNMLGQKVATLINRNQSPGTYQAEWNASDFSSGLYFCRLRTNTGFIQTKKLILLK